MRPSNSPLEHLAAFAIVFAAGILSAISLAAYVARVQRNPPPSHSKRTEQNAEFSLSASKRGGDIE
jgi:hypothetical protein